MRVVTDEGEQLGVMTIEKAIEIADERELDLVEIAPQATPPVCKIIDYGKYRFEQKKKEKEQKKKQKVVHLKELTMGPTIEKHDFEVKLKQAQKFLAEGDKVKFTVKFKGRQIAHKEMGEDILKRFTKDLEGSAEIEKNPFMEGRKLMLIVGPKKQ